MMIYTTLTSSGRMRGVNGGKGGYSRVVAKSYVNENAHFHRTQWKNLSCKLLKR